MKNKKIEIKAASNDSLITDADREEIAAMFTTSVRQHGENLRTLRSEVTE